MVAGAAGLQLHVLRRGAAEHQQRVGVFGDLVPGRHGAGDRAGVADDVGQQALGGAVAVVGEIARVSAGAGEKVVELGLGVMQAPGAGPAVGAAVDRRGAVLRVCVLQGSGHEVQRRVPADVDERIDAAPTVGAVQPGGADGGPGDAVLRMDRALHGAQQRRRVAVSGERGGLDDPAVLDLWMERTPVRTVDRHCLCSSRPAPWAACPSSIPCYGPRGSGRGGTFRGSELR